MLNKGYGIGKVPDLQPGKDIIVHFSQVVPACWALDCLADKVNNDVGKQLKSGFADALLHLVQNINGVGINALKHINLVLGIVVCLRIDRIIVRLRRPNKTSTKVWIFERAAPVVDLVPICNVRVGPNGFGIDDQEVGPFELLGMGVVCRYLACKWDGARGQAVSATS